MASLSSIMVSAGIHMSPYFEELMPKLLSYLSSSDAKDDTFWAKTVIAIGRLARAVGKEKYQPYLEPVSQQVMGRLNEFKILEAIEAGFSYFADIALMLKNEFAPLLPTLVPLVMKSCLSENGLQVGYKKDIIDLESDNEEQEMETLAVNTASIDEKCSALFAMGIFALSCPKEFLPYIDECIKTLEVISLFLHDSDRAQAIQAYQDLVESLNLAHYETEKHPSYVVGLPAPVKLPPNVHKLYYGIVLPFFVDRIRKDDSREVVGKVLEALYDLCEHMGPAIVEEKLDELFEIILLLLNGKAVCQTEEEEDEDEEEEEADSDAMIIDNTMELTQIIAKVCGEAIIPYMKPIFKALGNYLKPKRPEEDWALGIGCFSEIFNNLPSAIPEYAKDILPLCYKYCKSDNDSLIWNSAYCIGIIAKGSKAVAEANLNEMLLALKNGYEAAKGQEPKDNAVSSILRLLVIFPDKLPLEIILPAVFNNIPLNGDVKENLNIAKSLIDLLPEVYKANPKYLENALMSCVKCIVDDECLVKDEDKLMIGNYLVKMATIAEDVLKGIISKMSATEVSQLQKFMSQN